MKAHKGWECPKCGRVNAPWVATCPCYRRQQPITIIKKERERWIDVR